jgi:hypothetical protein
VARLFNKNPQWFEIPGQQSKIRLLGAAIASARAIICSGQKTKGQVPDMPGVGNALSKAILCFLLLILISESSSKFAKKHFVNRCNGVSMRVLD